MSEITHQKAHALLQAAADGPLGVNEKSALDAHLTTCKECNDYARSLTTLEADLRKVFHAQWDRQRPPAEGLNVASASAGWSLN